MDSVILIREKYKERLGGIRQAPGWLAAVDKDRLWLKGPVNNGAFQKTLSALPSEGNYLMDEQGRLFPVGRQTPVRTLKELDWQPLREFLPLEMPVSAMPGVTEATIPLKLKRSTIEHPIYALKTTLVDWKAYAEAAPAIRLEALRFAVSEKAEVLVVGTPLPALRGSFYWSNQQLLLPAGFDFDPPVLAALMPASVHLSLFDESGNLEYIPQVAFTPADRKTIRLL